MEKITVQTIVNEPIEKVWDAYNNPKHITKWNHASDDWHSPRAVNDLRQGGVFNIRLEAKDGSEGFDFTGIYDEVDPHKKITYTMGDGRKVEIQFEEMGNSTAVTITFDPENENPIEMQREGWQATLNNFRDYAEKMK